jgi:hypothetical protein
VYEQTLSDGQHRQGARDVYWLSWIALAVMIMRPLLTA